MNRVDLLLYIVLFVADGAYLLTKDAQLVLYLLVLGARRHGVSIDTAKEFYQRTSPEPVPVIQNSVAASIHAARKEIPRRRRSRSIVGF
jgi:hypothetical protein